MKNFARRTALVALCFGAQIAVLRTSTGCSAQEKQEAKSVTRPAIDAACIVAKANMPDERVRDLCKVAPDLVDVMIDILGVARTHGACFAPADGGTK